MRALTFGFALLMTVAGALPAGASEGDAPPPARVQGDPADSVYRAARAALNGRAYLRAAELFARIAGRFPKSAYAPDALYWRAFALYRIGGEDQLRDALRTLRQQRTTYPKAGTRGDAAALDRAASDIAGPPVPPVPPLPPGAAAPPVPPTPPAVLRMPGVLRVPPVPLGPRAIGGCAADDDDIKVAALNALQQMDADRAGPILRRVLAKRDSGSACLRQKAVFLMAQQGGNDAVDALLGAARTDPDRDVREQAVFWLSQVGNERSVGALDSILRTSTDPSIQEKALFALSQQGSPRAAQALRAYAEHGDISEESRGKALFWLGQSGRSEDAAFLRSLYGRLKSPELKKRVLVSLAQSGSADNAHWLLDVARNAGEPIAQRKDALFWASQSGVGTDELAALYGSLSDRTLREQLIFVLSQRDDRAAADRLVDIAKHDPDPELRKKALFWLGQMNDPRVAQVLQEIIDQ
jgi:HEAT repeat protein